MPILSDDIVLLLAETQTDTADGGGRMTGNVLVDGVSNNLMPDIAELDRVYGRVQIRKIFAAALTDDTDVLSGTHLIVAQAPADPHVSATLLTTRSSFDRRVDAAKRIEAYLFQGALRTGLLFGDHIAGQASLTLLQRIGLPLPQVGETLVVRKGEGTISVVEQYVRIIDVAAAERTFTDGSGDFARVQVTLTLSGPLEADYPGFGALRLDSDIDYTDKSKVYETLVADAARYFGIVPLASAAATGDYVVRANGIFTQIVPSAQAETPVADARVNQRSAAAIPATTGLVATDVGSFEAGVVRYIGAFAPATLSVATGSGSTTVTDDGAGRLLLGSTAVGTCDYASGVLTVTGTVATSGAAIATFLPAGFPGTVTDTLGLRVTAITRALTYVVTLVTLPARGSLSIAYRAQGRWYTLQDDGTGAIRGADSSLGAGFVNYLTQTVSVTLGALPDVGSRVLLTWGQTAATIPMATGALPTGFVLDAAKALTPGSVEVTWASGTKVANDNGTGGVTGDAIGSVYYASGRILLLPNVLPAPATPWSLDVVSVTPTSATVVSFTDSGGAWTGTVGHVVKERTFNAQVFTSSKDWGEGVLDQLTDDGAGNILLRVIGGNIIIGTLTYSTGNFSITKAIPTRAWSTIALVSSGGSDAQPQGLNFLAVGNTTGAWTVRNANGIGTNAMTATFASTTGSGATVTGTFAALVGDLPMRSGFLAAPDSVRITQAGAAFATRPVNTVTATLVDAEGTTAGTVLATGTVSLTTWTTGAAAAALQLVGGLLISSAGTVVSAAVFRTALAPVRPGSFSVVATLLDGTAINVTADSSGVIDSARCVGRIDWQTGIADVRFGVKRTTLGDTPPPNRIDISHLDISGAPYIDAEPAVADTLRYNAVGYTYIPLSAEILGLNPVRLPTDGRVPIFRPGDVAMVHHTYTLTLDDPAPRDTVIDLEHARLASVRVRDSANVTVTDTLYEVDLDAGEMMIPAASSLASYVQPLTVESRIEDLGLISDAQITGEITMTRPVTHDYPSGSMVSSALIAGDLQAHAYGTFAQAAWTGEWSDSRIGAPPESGAQYNTVTAPLAVTNRGAVTERWAIIFTNTTAFRCIGENSGEVGTGNTGSSFAPVNPATSAPYFTIDPAGWGAGWVPGNLLRFNTDGCNFPVWVIRTILQGPAGADSDQFAIAVRGDVDAP